MDLNVFSFLQKYQIGKGGEHTHTSFIKPTGAFYIPVNAQDAFIDLYKTCIKKNEYLYITEKHRDFSPILIDLDFRYEKENTIPIRHHTPDDIKIIVQNYLSVLKKYVVIPDDLAIYVMEKPAPVIDKVYVKDGIHIVIPDIVTKPSLQYILRNELIALLPVQFAHLPLKNSWDDVIDNAIIEKNNWMMYGSRKPNAEPYKITYIFDKNMELLPINEDHTTYVDILSIRNKFDLTEVTPAFEEAELKYEEEKERQARKQPVKMSNVSIFQSYQNIKKNTVNDSDSEYIKKLVNILDIDRANNYQKWVRLGWCLRNIDYRLIEVWIEFSQRSPKFQEGECEKMWNYMKDDGLNLGSLHLWAKEDNPDEYKNLIKRGLQTLLNNSVSSGTHTDIAEVVHYMYKYEYVCVSIKNNCWYEFRNHRWMSCDSGFSLRNKISKELCDVYYNYRIVLSQNAAMAEDDDARKGFDVKLKKLGELIPKLKTCSFKDNIMKESREIFYIEKFEEKLDSRCHLVGFENGVFDLESYEFREGRPEDYISFTSGVNYNPYVEDDNARDLHEFINRIFTKPHMKEYFLTLLASFLNGNIKEERFHILTGGGSNGKSKVLDLFEQSFGDYCCKLPITLLTQKRASSNAATSELARTKGKRFACLQEPSEDEKLNVGLMKELTGGDKIMARAIYKEPIEFKPQFKMVLTCNTLPTVPSNDNGTWRRLRVIEFTSKFVDHPNPDNDNEFEMDMDLTQKFAIWKEYFISLLINYYKKYTEGGVTEPDEVLVCTKEYQRNNDVFLDFVEQEFEKNDMTFVSFSQVINCFKSWLKENNINHVSLKLKELTSNLEKCFGKRVSVSNINGFKGWQFKNDAFNIHDELNK